MSARRTLVAFVFVLVAVAGCRSRDPHATIAALVSDVDRRDADAALERMVSPAQLAAMLECPPSTKSDWLTPAARKASLDHAREKWMQATAMRVALGDLFEEYDRPSQWPTYRAGDVLGDCRVKTPFAREVYRVVLVFDGGFMKHVESTKPIEIWRIDGRVYVWDDPLDTEVWE